MHAWAAAGLAEQLNALALTQDDRLIGLDLRQVWVDGCVTKDPGGGEHAGRSPVNRGKHGRKRSLLTDAAGIPLHLVAAGANCPDRHLLRATLAGLRRLEPLPPVLPVLLDRDYAGTRVPAVLAEMGCVGGIPPPGDPAPGHVGARWVVERTTACSTPLAGASVPGAPGRGGGPVPVPGGQHHRHPATPARCSPYLPLADTHHDPSPQVNPIAGRCKQDGQMMPKHPVLVS